MLLEMAIGDAYGACLESCKPEYVKQSNDLTYRQNAKWQTLGNGRYTDDTQMAIGLAEFLLLDHPRTPERLAECFLQAYKRDPRSGYMPGFRKVLDQVTSGADFLRIILPHSKKSGGAMRAAPCGLLADRSEVFDLAMWQASLTHGTRDGMNAAAASALLVWLCRDGCPRDKLGVTIRGMVPGYAWDEPWRGPVPVDGVPVVRAAVTAVSRVDSLKKVLRLGVSFTGDVDTLLAVAMPAASLHPHITPDIPQNLIDGLENGQYGRDFLADLDWRLFTKFKVTPPHRLSLPDPPLLVPELEPESILDLL